MLAEMTIQDVLGLLLLCGLVIIVVFWTVVTAATKGQTKCPPAGGHPSFEPTQTTLYYRTLDGTEDYHFCIQEVRSGDFRIYILEQPGPPRGPHRLCDASGDFICWSGAITSYSDAKQIAKKWAEATEKYRKTGKSF